MRMLHGLAVIAFIVLAAVAVAQFDAGLVPLWKALLLPLGGFLMPYAVAFFWAFSVAPPDLRELVHAWRSRRTKAGRGGE
ncbi:hypothetical protein [Arenimonas sp.]|uniref:hypothetical protein n=1 Tax=Arenimonas sp. TaxID=1872635 RepID=UPI002E306218|nr:hypothetical protein [Arenimonas sp.]HEX4855082.1 hypothetical protein [Arenimonas sp.]